MWPRFYLLYPRVRRILHRRSPSRSKSNLTNRCGYSFDTASFPPGSSHPTTNSQHPIFILSLYFTPSYRSNHFFLSSTNIVKTAPIYWWEKKNLCIRILNLQFPAMRTLSLQRGDAFILVYDVTKARTFEEIRHTRDEIHGVRHTNNVPIVVVGNKTDLVDVEPREVSFLNKITVIYYGSVGLFFCVRALSCARVFLPCS